MAVSIRRQNRVLCVSDDVDQGKRNLEEQGYTIHREYVDPDTLSRLRDRLEEQAALEREHNVALLSSTGHAGNDRHFGGSASGLPVSQQILFLPNKGRCFLDLLHNPIGAAYASHVFRNVPYNCVTQAGAILRKGGKRQVLHADQQALPFQTPVPVMINVLLCLSDFDEDMGATNVVPGSHRHGSPDLALDAHEAAESIGSSLIPMTAKAGDALVFESRTWHCQGDAVSDRTRMSIGNVYGMHFMKPQDVYPAIIHDDVYPTLSEADRNMLGFKVHYEYAGRIAPRYPGDGRANTNARYPYVPALRRGATAALDNSGGHMIAESAVYASYVR